MIINNKIKKAKEKSYVCSTYIYEPYKCAIVSQPAPSYHRSLWRKMCVWLIYIYVNTMYRRVCLGKSQWKC